MSKSRSPSKRKSDAAGSELVPTQEAPTGILPHSLARGDANDDVVEMLAKAFAVCYPDVEDIGELDKGERSAWIHLRDGLLRGHKAAIEILKGMERMLETRLEAEAEDLRERRAEELKDSAARRKRKNQRHAQELEMDQKERMQTLEEREIRSANQSLKERLLLCMTAISFGCLIASLFATILTGHTVVYGSGAVFFSAVSVLGMIRLFIFGQEKESEVGPSPPHVSG
jgi:hypothetical protein